MVNASQLVELFSISIFPWGICHVCMTYLYMVWSCFVILRDVESVCIKLLVRPEVLYFLVHRFFEKYFGQEEEIK